MNGINRMSSALVTLIPSTDWDVVGTGDLHGDGSLAILFEDIDGNLTAWYVRGSNQATTVRLNPPTTGDAQWRVVGTIDLNRDGKTDLLFQHSGDGSMAVWFMDGINLTEGRLLNPSNPGGTWKIVAPK